MQKTTKWHLIDLEDKTLGRLATRIATLLIGKHKPTYLANLDDGDYVVAINSDKLKLSGNKLNDKRYNRHSGYPGGFKSETAKELMVRDSRKLVERAVRGMLPKNKLQSIRLTRLKVYPGKEHPYEGQISS